MDDLIIQKGILALLPAILVVLYIRYRDRKNPEPWSMIFKGVFFGCLTVPVVIFLGKYVLSPCIGFMGFGWILDDRIPVIGGIFDGFILAAVPEESVKLLFLWLLFRKCKEYDEYLDGIVYAVLIGMGFAGIENIKYLFINFPDDWEVVSITRAIFSVPGHYMFAVLMGYFYSLVHFNPQRYGRYRILVWLAPVIAHGLFDAIQMASGWNVVMSILGTIILVVFCVLLHQYCMRRIKDLQDLDQDRDDMNQFMQNAKME